MSTAPPAATLALREGVLRYLTESGAHGFFTDASRALLIEHAAQGLARDFRWIDVIRPEEWPGFLAQANQALRADGSFELACGISSFPSGCARVQVSGRHVRDARGNPVCIEGSIIALSQPENDPEALARSEQRAKELARNIVAVVSHDIRSPLIGVIGMLQLLRKAGLTERQQGYVTLASESCERILEMAKNLLDFARIDSGHDELRLGVTDVAAVADSVVSLHREHARGAGIALRLEVGEGFPRALLADEIKLRQILGNLISNAVKFSRQGEVLVELSHACLPRGRSALLAEVSDTGMGFDIARTRQLFDQFTQMCRDASSCRHGAGLGLTIVKGLVDLFGGSICASTQPGQGSTFHVFLPLVRVSGENCLLALDA